MNWRLFIFFLIFSAKLHAQPSVAWDSARLSLDTKIKSLPKRKEWNVGSIDVEGNKRTKKYIIVRELLFNEGDWIHSEELFDKLSTARLNVLNTQLFLEVIPSIEYINDSSIHVKMIVKERWYIFPIPYFKPIDRNPNQWLVEQRASLERVTYGLKFNWENVTGRRDKLRFNYVNGYSRQFLLYYEQPYADRKLQHGFLAGISYSRNRQLVYATDNNKQVFFPQGNNNITGLITSSFRVEAGYTYRPGINERHTFRVSFGEERIPDTISIIIQNNNNKGFIPYFTNDVSRQAYGEFSYTYQFFNVNNIAYPWKGFAFNSQLIQRGLGIKGMNLWQVKAKAGRYVEIGKKTSFSLIGIGLLKLPFKQPLYNLQAHGYADFYLRGLEYYVIDGVMAGIIKSTVRRELLEIKAPTIFIKNEKYKKIPFKLVAKAYGDIGGVHLPNFTNSTLNNRLLYTWGFGLDVLSYYDFAACFEYSFNQLGEKGLFLHLRRDF